MMIVSAALPVQHDIALPHVAEVLNELPHAGILNSNFINIHCQEGEPCTSQQTGHILAAFRGSGQGNYA